jgi:hypothetical protein
MLANSNTHTRWKARRRLVAIAVKSPAADIFEVVVIAILL